MIAQIPLKEDDISEITHNLNSIYSQSGIIIEVNYNGNDTINYDSIKEDSKLDDPRESGYAHV